MILNIKNEKYFNKLNDFNIINFFFLLVIYIQFGLLLLIQIIIWLLVFFGSNFLIGINPFSREMHIIRFMSIIVIIFLLYYNLIQSTIMIAFIIPLSVDRITFADEFPGALIYDSDIKTERLFLFKQNEISDIKKKTRY